MNPLLLSTFITQIAMPELVSFLHGLHQSGTPVTDAVVFAELKRRTDSDESDFEAWLAAHPQ
jgi:hypothetical protein